MARLNSGCVASIRLLLALLLVAGLSFAAPAASEAAAPVVNLSPSSGPIGTKVMVSVCGLTPGTVIVAGNITFAGQPWNPRPITVDSAGCMCATELVVPPAAAGPNAVMVNAGNVTVTGAFTVTLTKITVSPLTGYKGQKLTVSGSGWPQRTPGAVSISFNGDFMKYATPNSSGSFSVEITVPVSAGASNVIGATDILGNSAPPQVFTLKSVALTVAPNSGLPGTMAKVTGVGFEPLSSIDELKIANVLIETAGILTSEIGTFSKTFTVPSMPGGGQIVSATVAGLTLTTCYTVLDPAVWGPPDDTIPIPIEQCLSTIADRIVRAWGFYGGEWQMYDPDDPLGSNLIALVAGRAYWVKVSEDCRLIFRDLKAGWNNIGW